MKSTQRNDVLKLIALLTMLVDHIGYLFYPHMMIFRTIGRIAFPIFAYQIAEGYQHTSDRLAYSKRLAIFGVISAVPYAFFNPQLSFDPYTMNIMFLLLMGVGAMAIWDKAISTWQLQDLPNHKLFSGIYLGAWVVYMMVPRILTITYDIKLSYAGYGLWMMMLFFWFSKKPLVLLGTYMALSFIGPLADGLVAYAQAYSDNALTVLGVSQYILDNFQHSYNSVLTLQGGLKTLGGFFFQSRSILGLGIIMLLKDRQFAFKMPKAVAYWFYPVHMTLLMLGLKFF